MKQLYFVLALGLASCAAGSEPEAVDRRDVIGGRRDTRHRAVGQVGHISGDWADWVCTGTLIDRLTVLTAAHCLYDLNGMRRAAPELLFDDGEWIHEVRSARTRRYSPDVDGPWNDIAILSLFEPSEVEPIRIALDPPVEGEEAVVVGFGVTRATGPHTGTGGGTRRSGRISIDQVGERELFYAVDAVGACYGDSGGPLLFERDGEERVGGVTSRGTQADCRGIDVATRVDAYADWIHRWSGG